MQQAPDSSNAVVRPPIALAVAFAAGLVLDWLYPLPFVPIGIGAWILVHVPCHTTRHAGPHRAVR
jgi:Fe-S oxidoreductase